jgi:hypothetical protein
MAAPDKEAGASDLARALEQVIVHGQKLLDNGDENGDARQRLVASARDLIFAAEDPVDSLLWHMWGEVCQSSHASPGRCGH